MQTRVVDIKCPGCGGGLDTSQKQCVYCGRPVVITSFHSFDLMPTADVVKYANSYRKAMEMDPEHPELLTAAALCYLKMKLYDNALSFFEKAIAAQMDNAENYFHAAVCTLKGQKAFVASIDSVRKAIEYTSAACSIEPRGVFYFFLAYLKYDCFHRKHLRISPDYEQELHMARNMAISHADIQMLVAILGKELPEALQIFG